MGIFNKFRRCVSLPESIDGAEDAQVYTGPIPPVFTQPISAPNDEYEPLIGKQSSNGILSIKITDISIAMQSRCKQICPQKETCTYLNFCNNIGNTDFLTTEVVVIIDNSSKDLQYIFYEDFCVIDEEDISHKAIHFCDKYSYPNICESYLKIPPHAKIKFAVNFPSNTNQIKGIVYKTDTPISIRFGEEITAADVKDLQIEKLNDTITKLKEQIEFLRNQNFILIDKNRNLNDKQSELLHDGISPNHLIKYKVNEDNNWYKIVSDEENYTLSFNREFDKSKSNYNWINIGDPLITIRIDNVSFSSKSPTLLSSPVSGLFEFDKNKLIRYGEVICRIKKIDQSLKQETIDNLEREEIKQSVYKKERKKMIERETLDELIAEGKVFNVITAKNGNRMTIPQDVASAVWNRDGGRCCMCGSRTDLEFDHIIPLSKGGASTFRNLQLLCKNCNIKKSDKI